MFDRKYQKEVGLVSETRPRKTIFHLYLPVTMLNKYRYQNEENKKGTSLFYCLEEKSLLIDI